MKSLLVQMIKIYKYKYKYIYIYYISDLVTSERGRERVGVDVLGVVCGLVN